ncbi:LexA family protein [Streptomyces mirabilis]|uniref:LexA family protein n=1 Tax=Streptomyces TaxID=1883 RepID=UPI0026B94C8E
MGDLVVVWAQPTADQGDVVAAMLEGEATVSSEPICGNGATILGIVTAVMRKV